MPRIKVMIMKTLWEDLIQCIRDYPSFVDSTLLITREFECVLGVGQCQGGWIARGCNMKTFNDFIFPVAFIEPPQAMFGCGVTID